MKVSTWFLLFLRLIAETAFVVLLLEISGQIVTLFFLEYTLFMDSL